jgi:sulfoxide reductase heme-binding subunit YedZ
MSQHQHKHKRGSRRWITYFVSFVLTLILYVVMKPGYAMFKPVESFSMFAGYAAYLFIALTLLVGPVSRWLPGRIGSAFLRTRRDFGIWTGVLVFVHVATVFQIYQTGFSFMILHDHQASQAAGWLGLFLSRDLNTGQYYFQMSMTVLANLLGLVAFLFILIMWLTSSDRARRLLGGNAWRRIHGTNLLVLILVFFHGLIYIYSIKGTPLGLAKWMAGIIMLVLFVKAITFIRSVRLMKN